MADERLPKRATELREQGRRRRGRPILRWEDCIKRDVKKTGEEGDWKKKTGDREGWRRIADEAVKKLQAAPHPDKGKRGRERHTRTQTRSQKHARTHARARTPIHTQTDTHTDRHIHTGTHARTHARTHAHTHTHTTHTHTTHARTHARTHTHKCTIIMDAPALMKTVLKKKLWTIASSQSAR